jgi:hypothetical protein
MLIDKINPCIDGKITRIAALPYSGQLARQGCRYEQLLQNFQVYSEDR